MFVALCGFWPPVWKAKLELAVMSSRMPYQTLIEALQRVHSGGRFMRPPVARALASRMPDSDFSSRELEVLELLVRGKSNQESATKLGATVKSHASTILMRLNVEDRTQAAVTALRRGLVHL